MKKLNYLLLALLIILIASCSTAPKPKIKIAISKASGSENYEKYEQWIKRTDYNVETIDLYKLDFDDAVSAIAGVDGLLLSGGPDLHPKHYNKAEDSARCVIDLHRDSLELELIKQALKQNMPILAICRGEQILNVALGGDLIVDIPQDVPQSKVVHQIKDGDANHKILVKKGTLLYKITDEYEGLVNSNHHQAVGKLAPELDANAITEDKMIEAYSYKNFDSKPYLLGVQWHPERLPYESPFSKNIAKSFIENAYGYNRMKYPQYYTSSSSSVLTVLLWIFLTPLIILGLIIFIALLSWRI